MTHKKDVFYLGTDKCCDSLSDYCDAEAVEKVTKNCPFSSVGNQKGNAVDVYWKWGPRQ